MAYQKRARTAPIPAPAPVPVPRPAVPIHKNPAWLAVIIAFISMLCVATMAILNHRTSDQQLALSALRESRTHKTELIEENGKRRAAFRLGVVYGWLCHVTNSHKNHTNSAVVLDTVKVELVRIGLSTDSPLLPQGLPYIELAKAATSSQHDGTKTTWRMAHWTTEVYEGLLTRYGIESAKWFVLGATLGTYHRELTCPEVKRSVYDKHLICLISSIVQAQVARVGLPDTVFAHTHDSRVLSEELADLEHTVLLHLGK